MGAADSNARPSVTSRVLALLGAFDEKRPSLTLTELAAEAELPVSTAHRLVGELVKWDALRRAPDGRYVIGQRLWMTGALSPVARELRDVALPVLEDLHEATLENVQLAVREGQQALCIETIRGRRSDPNFSRPGDLLPLHATGVGKVMLAWAPREVIDECLQHLAPLTPNTITEPERMERELAMVRRAGHARTLEEAGPRSWSVAVPVRVGEDRVVAAVGVVTRAMRGDLVNLVPAMQMAAAAISRALPPPPSR